MKSGDQQYLEELSGDTCHCGAGKARNQTFCTTCYFKLPREMRARLYKRMGHGYEEAVDEAKAYLKEPAA